MLGVVHAPVDSVSIGVSDLVEDRDASTPTLDSLCHCMSNGIIGTSKCVYEVEDRKRSISAITATRILACVDTRVPDGPISFVMGRCPHCRGDWASRMWQSF